MPLEFSFEYTFDSLEIPNSPGGRARQPMNDPKACRTGTPFPDSYWVVPGRFLAGEYPRNLDESESLEKIRSLLSFDIKLFLDLTEPGESSFSGAPLLEYDSLLEKAGLPVEHKRFPIPDRGIASVEAIKRILDEIDRNIGEGRPVYLHCWGGHGRTGLVAGCWLARHGEASREEVLDRLRSLRAGMPDGWKNSPETAEQISLVLGWNRGK